MTLETVLGRLRTLIDKALEIWSSGGWAMFAIAAVALVIFGLGIHVHLALRAKGFSAVPERRWRRWIDHPREREGPIGELLDFVTGGQAISDTALFFEQLRSTESAPFERDLKVMRICVSAAPLVGLLGTVTGMLATFGALSSGSGGEETMGLVAKGISEALITTETGLVIALPGVFFQYHLARRFEAYKAFLAHLETVCSQSQYRARSGDDATRVRRTAQRALARALHGRLRERPDAAPHRVNSNHVTPTRVPQTAS